MTKKKKDQNSDKSIEAGLINYPVGDFLIRIKNAALAGKKVVVGRNTKFVASMCRALEKEGFLYDVKEDGDKIRVKLMYSRKRPVLLNLKLISRPGLREYLSVDKIEKIKGPEILFLSTPKGILSGRDAIKNRVGGELIVKIW